MVFATDVASQYRRLVTGVDAESPMCSLPAGVVQTSLNVLKSLPILSGIVRREVDKVLVCYQGASSSSACVLC